MPSSVMLPPFWTSIWMVWPLLMTMAALAGTQCGWGAGALAAMALGKVDGRLLMASRTGTVFGGKVRSQ
ncbi:MAG: hypothetical protein R3C46_04060 [Hyphomonadaceae bacterium]